MMIQSLLPCWLALFAFASAHAADSGPQCRMLAGRWLHEKLPQIIEVSPDCRVRVNECSVKAEVTKNAGSADGKNGNLEVKVTEVGVKIRSCPIVGLLTSCSYARGKGDSMNWNCPGVGIRGVFNQIEE